MSQMKLGVVFDVKNGKFKSDVKESTAAIEKVGLKAIDTSNKLKPFNINLENAGFKLAKTNKVALAVSQAINGFGNSTQRLTSKTNNLGTELTKTNTQMGVTNAGTKNLGIELTKTSTQMGMTNASTKALTASLAKLDTTIGLTNQLMTSSTNNTQRSTAATNTLVSTNKSASATNGKLASSLNTTNTALAATTKNAHAAHGSIGDMVKSMAIMSAVMGTVGLGAKLVTDLATFQDLRVRLQGMSDGAVDYAEKEGYLIDLAARHHKELVGLAGGYAGLSVMVKENIINDEQARAMLEGLSNAAAATGADAANLKQVFYGLNQTLGQGTVQAQELNQVVEPMPGLLSKLAKVAGQETGAAFRKLVGEGKVTSEMFAVYMVQALKEYDGAAAKTANNLNAKFADISNAYLLLSKNLEAPINNALLPVLDGLAVGLTALGENADVVSNVVFGAFALATAKVVSALAKKETALTKSIVTERAAANAALVQARAEEKLAMSYKASAVGSVQNNIADKRLIASRTALTAATARLNVVNKGFAALSGVVGGLPGLLTLAAFATYELATSFSEATDQAKRLNEENKKLNPFANYTFKTATGALQRYKGQLEIAQQMADETQTRFKNPFFKNVTASDVLKANKEVQKLTETIVALQAIVDGKSEKKAETPTQNKKGSDAFAKQRDALVQNIGLLGRTTELAKTEYEVTVGKYRDLLPAQKTQLINLAKTLDYQNKINAADVLASQKDKKLANELSKIEESLSTEEEAINASYLRRQQIVDTALLGKLGQEQKYNNLTLGLEAQKDAQLKALSDKKLAEQQRIEEARIQAELNAREQEDQFRRDGYAAELAELRGFTAEKLAIKAGATEQEIAQARLRNLSLQEEEYAHNEAVMAQKTRRTGDMQGTLMQFANFEKKTSAEKTSAVIGIGEFGFKAMAGQSKKAFAMYKAFSIGQALIKTYEAATGAYAALAPIPIVGPALGVAAAAAAVVSGLAQVNQIKAQKPAGFEHGGNIGNNNVIEFGERNKPEVLEFGGRNYLLGGNQGAVFNQSQLTEINGGRGGDSISISTPITIQGNADESVIAELIERNYEAVYNAMVQAKADRGEAA